MDEHIVVVGGGYAGLIAALRLKGSGARVTLVSPMPELVERIRLHQWAVGQTPPRRFFLPLLERAGITFVEGRARKIAGHTLDVERTGGSVDTLTFTRCIYAIGGHTDRALIDGAAEHAFTLDQASVPKLLEKLRTTRGDVVVIGGGLTGIETATEIAETWPDARVKLICAGRLVEELTEGSRAVSLEVCAKLGITVMEHVTVTRVTSTGVVLADGSVVPAAVCVQAAGMLAPSLAKESGLRTDAQGRLLVDATLRALDNPDVIGAGDAVHVLDAGRDAATLGCKVAMPMGAHAADVVRALMASRAPPAFSFRIAGFCVSLGRRHALFDMLNGRVVTGRTAVLVKELICRFTWWAVVAEAWRPGTYAWLKASQSAPQLAAATSHSHSAP